MSCKLFICRSGHLTVLECEGQHSDCTASDCDSLVIKRDWCPKHKQQLLGLFEKQFPKLRYETK